MQDYMRALQDRVDSIPPKDDGMKEEKRGRKTPMEKEARDG
mgnify:CR=1 FL=1|jgi:hypothetical protein